MEIMKKFDAILQKYIKTADILKDKLPHSAIDKKYDENSWRPQWWTNGFWGGILLYLHQLTKEERFYTYYKGVERKLDTVLDLYLDVDHDAGFMWHLTSVADYKMTKNIRSRTQGLKAASFLTSRFNVNGRYLRAWNGTWGMADGIFIIDSLMNIPLLYWSSEELKDVRFKSLAMQHADTVLKEHLRADGSLFHIVEMDAQTGKRVGQRYGQGYSENSSWSRGTAWAIYGFALSAEHTGEARYLEAAERVAAFIQKHLPADFVPFNDYLAPADDKMRKRDSSAGAITACGLILLHKLTKKQKYLDLALKMLEGLYKLCLSPEDYESVLLHGNGAYHNLENGDNGLIYGDYYFLEAFLLLKDLRVFSYAK